jgi:hypothetical protein
LLVSEASIIAVVVLPLFRDIVVRLGPRSARLLQFPSQLNRRCSAVAQDWCRDSQLLGHAVSHSQRACASGWLLCVSSCVTVLVFAGSAEL